MSTNEETTAPITENEVHSGNLDEVQSARMRDLFGDAFIGLFQRVFARGAIVAGGAAVYVLAGNVPRESVGDIDIFIPNSNHPHLMQIAREVDAVFEQLGVARTYWAQQSALKIIPASCTPIQIVLSSHPSGGIIKMFDLDYVQCALTSPDHFIITELARRAHESRTVSYAIDDKFNPMRLIARLHKAQLKGFGVPCAQTRVCDLGVRLYRPRPCTHDEDWERELQMCAGRMGQMPAQMPANAQQFPSLDAMRDGYKFVEIFERADYDQPHGIGDDQRMITYARIPCESLRTIKSGYIRLRTVVCPERRIGSLATHIEARIAALRSEIARDPIWARKDEYHIRALALMIDENIPPKDRFRQAFQSAIADSTKLEEERNGSIPAFAFGQVMEMRMWAENGGATSAYETECAISRLFS